jgi:hypothetical protein
MLPVTLFDETESLVAIAFTMVAEDLVEQNAYLTSENMKIDSLDHIAALDKAIGKKRVFHIGTSSSGSSDFAIKYARKKDTMWIHQKVPFHSTFRRYFIFYLT